MESTDVTMGQVVRIIKGKSFYDPNLPTALRAAQKFSRKGGKGGFVASLPQLVDGLLVAPKGDPLWKWHTANSSENVGTTVQGTPVLAIQHGGGLWTPGRIEKAYEDDLTQAYGGRLSPKEFQRMLAGKVRGGEIPVFEPRTVDNLAENILLPNYVIVLDFAAMAATRSGQFEPEAFAQNLLAVARAGGQRRAAAYASRACEVLNRSSILNSHRLASVDPVQQPEGWLLFRGDDGVLGNDDLNYYYGRFVGVQAPEAQGVVPARASAPPLDKQVDSLYAGLQSVIAPVNEPVVRKVIMRMLSLYQK